MEIKCIISLFQIVQIQIAYVHFTFCNITVLKFEDMDDRSKAVLLLWIFYVFVLSCVCYVFVHVCLYVLCGHLLGKG